ncbi:MAG: hypothetical protein KOO63_07985 [Bacteroidales bacterium]|nr:hypothetical protein [Candidatus Latescibacterota bacterium]
MTEHKTWLKVAEVFASAKLSDDGFYDAGPILKEFVCGICDALQDMHMVGDITAQMCTLMKERLLLFSPDYRGLSVDQFFWWDTENIIGNQGRILACCFLAAMTDKEDAP